MLCVGLHWSTLGESEDSVLSLKLRNYYFPLKSELLRKRLLLPPAD